VLHHLGIVDLFAYEAVHHRPSGKARLELVLMVQRVEDVIGVSNRQMH
jgi:hypothetical protein